MTNPRILVLGGCNLRGPLFRAGNPRTRRGNAAWDDVPPNLKVLGPPFKTYTVGEMLQALSCWRGEATVPVGLYDLCHLTDRIAPTSANSPLGQCDGALIEPNTSVEIEFEGSSLNRWPVLRFVTPVGKISPTAKKLSSLWFKKGLLGPDDAVKRAMAEQLIPLIPADFSERELLIALLRGAIGRRRNLQEGLARVADRLDVPCGVVAFTWAYMPDGRALSWPDGFHEEVVGAANDLGLPLFEPRTIVRQAGLSFALKDLYHYSEAFMPVVAKPLAEFALSVVSNSARSRRYG